MRNAIRTLCLLPLLLGGCAVSKYCEGEHAYQSAPSAPPLRGVEGLQIPESAGALRIPPPPSQTVAYAETYKDADGDDAVRCLDRPPDMPPPPPEAKAEPAPVAPTPDAPPPAAPAPESAD